jgi:uncharacterized protein DUF6998
MGRKIKLPSVVATIYEATKRLNAEYPMRSFTPDGHLVGYLGEVIAAKKFKLTLLANLQPGHDAKDKVGRYVQIKLTAKNSISMYANCDRLIVMQIRSPEYAELIYDGDGAPIWAKAGKPQKNGQRKIGLSAIRRMSALHS